MGLVDATIYLKSDLLDPNFVTKTLGIEPERSWRKGEKRTAKRPGAKTYVAKTRLWTTGMWKHPLVDDDIPHEVPVIIDELLQRFDGRKEPLDQIAGVENAFLDILILGNVKEEMGGTEFILSKGQIQKISRLGLAIYTTTSFSEKK
jgi:hypothetical protein